MILKYISLAIFNLSNNRFNITTCCPFLVDFVFFRLTKPDLTVLLLHKPFVSRDDPKLASLVPGYPHNSSNYHLVNFG